MKKRPDGTEPPRDFEVEFASSWKRWVKHRPDAELEEVAVRLQQLKEGFGKPHLHGGLGIRRLSRRLFEFRLSRGLRVVFAFYKPRTLSLAMVGNHDEVAAWLRENRS